MTATGMARDRGLSVLVVTQMFPDASDPYAGVFIERQVRALRALEPGWRIGVLHVRASQHKSRYLLGLSDVRRACERLRPDLVHVHSGLCLLMTTAWHGPRVVTFHGSELAGPVPRWFCRLHLRRSDHVILVRGSMRQRWMIPSRVSIVPCGVDTELFHPAQIQQRGPGAPLIILFPGDPRREEKDYSLFAAVVRQLREQRPCEEVVLRGLAPAAAAKAIREADVVLYTSRREGSPVTSKEALCSATRVVAVDAGDLRQQLEGFSGCRIVAARDSAAIAAAVLQALTEPQPDWRVAARRYGLALEAQAIKDIYLGEVSRRPAGLATMQPA